MSKTKTVFVCRNCGAEALKWTGRCPSCGEWNTFTEEAQVITKNQTVSAGYSGQQKPVRLEEVNPMEVPRLDTRIGELNRVLGGGLVKGSVLLIGGEPGIGKSTLALQAAMAMDDVKVLYVSGEESIEQIRLRADRIRAGNKNCFVLNDVMIDSILGHIEVMKPDVVIIDSVQTMQDEDNTSSPGTVTQIRNCAIKLMRYAKETVTPVILIGHITKDGLLAGPKVLEHIVDTVLIFEGDTQHMFRMLRPAKNRFGATTELGIFEMLQEGLKEVTNPSEIFVDINDEGLSGVSVAATIDGIRPFLIEVQALVSTAAYGIPQRVCSGFDVRRLNMLLAVLEKRAGFKLGTRDVFINLAGGLRVTDPALDLAVVSAVLSSGFDRPVKGKVCFTGEIGLSGEVRPVSRIENRIIEAERLGFENIVISASHKKIKAGDIRLIKVSRIEEALKHVFGSSSGL